MVDFKVDGTRIYKQETTGGIWTEFILKGCNTRGPGYDALVQSTGEISTYWKQYWKFNSVRINCPLIVYQGDVVGVNTDENSNSYLEWGTSSKIKNAEFKALIDEFLENDLVVQIAGRFEVGVSRSDIDATEARILVDWFEKWATTYKDEPRVWFNILNEPNESSKTNWRAMHRPAIEAIRATGNKSIIIVDSSFWGQDVTLNSNRDAVSSTYLTKTDAEPLTKNAEGVAYNNVVFAVHAYDRWRPSDTTTTEAKRLSEIIFQRYIDTGLCIHMGELNANGISQSAQATYEHNVARGILQAAATKKIGRLYWAWHPTGGNPSLVSTSSSSTGAAINKTDGTKPTNLTVIGSAVWDDNHTTETGLDTLPGSEVGTMEFTSPAKDKVISKNDSATFTVEIKDIPTGKSVSSVKFERIIT